MITNQDITKHASYSKIDSLRFGIHIARVNDQKTPVQPTITDLKQAGFNLVIARVNLHEISLINEMEALGFQLKDAQNLYQFNIKNRDIDFSAFYNNKVSIVPFEKKHQPDVVRLTKLSFDGYGHYFANKRLPATKCLEAYTDWAERCCNDTTLADIMYVAEVDKKPVSFGCYKKVSTIQGDYVAGVLGAVDPAFRNMGLFRMIVAEGIMWGKTEGMSWYEHNVLCYNNPVNSLLISLGSRIVNTFATFHLWLDE